MDKNELRKLRKRKERIERKKRNCARIMEASRIQKIHNLEKKIKSQKDAESFKKELLKIKTEKNDVDRGALK